MDGGDDAIGVSGPHEGFGIGIGFGEEAVDGGLKIDNRVEHAAFEPPPRQPGEQSLDGIEPGARFRGEVENEARMPRQPGLHLGMLVGGIVVEDDMNDLADRRLGVSASTALRKRMNS